MAGLRFSFHSFFPKIKKRYKKNKNKKINKMANNMKIFQDLMYSTTSFEKKEILYR